jgi:hypothetical protein
MGTENLLHELPKHVYGRYHVPQRVGYFTPVDLPPVQWQDHYLERIRNLPNRL